MLKSCKYISIQIYEKIVKGIAYLCLASWSVPAQLQRLQRYADIACSFTLFTSSVSHVVSNLREEYKAQCFTVSSILISACPTSMEAKVGRQGMHFNPLFTSSVSHIVSNLEDECKGYCLSVSSILISTCPASMVAKVGRLGLQFFRYSHLQWTILSLSLILRFFEYSR